MYCIIWIMSDVNSSRCFIFPGTHTAHKHKSKWFERIRCVFYVIFERMEKFCFWFNSNWKWKISFSIENKNLHFFLFQRANCRASEKFFIFSISMKFFNDYTFIHFVVGKIREKIQFNWKKLKNSMSVSSVYSFFCFEYSLMKMFWSKFMINGYIEICKWNKL